LSVLASNSTSSTSLSFGLIYFNIYDNNKTPEIDINKNNISSHSYSNGNKIFNLHKISIITILYNINIPRWLN
jgi:hypothetical protein